MLSGSGSNGLGRVFLDFVGSVLHCLDDVLVTRAAAQVARHTHADLFFRRAWIVLQEAVSAGQHARCAEAALQTVLFIKTFLHSVQHAAIGQTFYGRNLAAFVLNRKAGAGLDRQAVNVNRAGAAVAGFATDMCASQIQFLAQEMDQQRTGFNGLLHFFAVDVH